MFEHRLGLALGKSISEVRAMPAEEFESWQLFYLVEPWGWDDREYRTGSILAMLNNVNVTKKSNARKVSDFMRDMQKIALDALLDTSAQEEKRKKLLDSNIEERKQMIAKTFGAKEVKIGNSSNDSR